MYFQLGARVSAKLAREGGLGEHPASAENPMTEDWMTLVELPRRAAPNLMESGRWPRRSTSGLAAAATVLRPLDADEVRRGIALRCSPNASFPVSRCHCRRKWCRSYANTNARRGARQRLPAATDYLPHRADRGLNCTAATLPAMHDLHADLTSPDGTGA